MSVKPVQPETQAHLMLEAGAPAEVVVRLLKEK